MENKPCDGCTGFCERFRCLFDGKMPVAARDLCKGNAAMRTAWDAEEAKLRASDCGRASPPPTQAVATSEPGILSKAARWAASTTAHAAAGFKPVSAEVRAARRAVCDGCEHRDAEKDTCKICGCPLTGWILGDKLGRPSEKCPVDKWGPVAEESSDA